MNCAPDHDGYQSSSALYIGLSVHEHFHNHEHFTLVSMSSLCLFCFFPFAGERPNLLNLLSFPSKKGNINIPQQISTKYLIIGIFLLNDETGTEVSTIISKHNEDAELINLEILKLWIEGKGKPPSWDTLIEVLKKTGLAALASNIKDSLQQ